MKHVAQRFAAGHRLRLAVSTTYFPMIWPAPEPVTLTLHTEDCSLDLPVRAPAPEDEALPAFGPPESGPPADIAVLEEGEDYFRIVEDGETGAMEMQIAEGAGRVRFGHNDLTLYNQGYERYRALPDDLDSVSAEAQWDFELARGDWQVETHTWTRLTADKEAFIVEAVLEAWENGRSVHRAEWDERIPRNQG